jgi:predicted lipoprotein with Yx(FWY)xxD motif
MTGSPIDSFKNAYFAAISLHGENNSGLQKNRKRDYQMFKQTLLALVSVQLVTLSAFAGDLVTVVTNKSNEHLIADASGSTLYIFDLDQGKTTSACSATCAEVWPPYLLTDVEAVNLKAPLGKIVRANQKPQLTYEGHPVYTYAFDRGTADEAGDGVGGVWHYIQVK